MAILNISVADLIVNPSNDRHEPKDTEAEAIEWLFENKPNEMLRLAERIVDDGRIFDIPLVMPLGKKFVVKDGNRRVTCLKLIHFPAMAPPLHNPFFTRLQALASDTLSEDIDCQVETDTTIIDQMVFLRHNGTQGGAGQLRWGPVEKANYSNRVSGKSDYQWPQIVEEALKEAGFETEAAMIKRSTLDRVIKVKKRREKLGLDIDETGRLISTNPQHDIFPLLKKLAHDMDQGFLTLSNTLRAEDIDLYLADLSSQGFQINDAPAGTNTSSNGPTGKAKPKPKPINRTKRTTLIPQGSGYHFQWAEGQSKIELAYAQLQYELAFKRNKFSIAIIFRVLLELTMEEFLRSQGKEVDAKLVNNVRKSCIALREMGELEKGIEQDIIRLSADSKSTLSVKNIQRVVHSTSQMPTEDDLRTIWDNYEPLINSAIRCSQ